MTLPLDNAPLLCDIMQFTINKKGENDVPSRHFWLVIFGMRQLLPNAGWHGNQQCHFFV